MLLPPFPDADIGVIIGRFQVHKLHEGHRDLIDTVVSRHKKVMILLGSPPGVLVTRNNPLDYQTRAAMIREDYPEIVVQPIKDMPSDEDWSKAVDRRIEEVFDVGTVVIYGSRNAFIPHYSGKCKVVELDSTREVSGTSIRNGISNEVRSSEEFRHGVVYAAFNRHPVAYPTIDLAILSEKKDYIILVRKKSDISGKWRFVGGFVDPRRDKSLEDTARREGREETGGVEFSPPKYVGSCVVNDWRYRGEQDGIITSLFCATKIFGVVKASDDVHEAEWFPVRDLVKVLIPEHCPLGRMLMAHLKKEQSNETPKPDSSDG